MDGLLEKLNYFGIALSLGCTALSLWIPFRLLPQLDSIKATVRGGTDLLTQDLLLQRGWSLYQTAADARSESLSSDAEEILRKATSIPTAFSEPINEALVSRLPPRDTEQRIGLSSVVEQIGVSVLEKGSLALQSGEEQSEWFLRSEKRVLEGIFLLTFGLNVFLLVQGSLMRRQRRLQSALAGKQRLLDTLFSSLREGILLCDAAGVIALCNESAARLLGVSSRRLIGMRLSQLMPLLCGEDGKPFDFEASELSRILQTASTVTGHVFGFLRGGVVPLWISLNTQPLALDESEGLVLSMTDVTERISAARTAELQSLQLAHADRFRVIGELASGIAHEINNPMTAITGVAEILGLQADRSRAVDPGIVKQAVEKILGMVSRSAKITESMTHMSRSPEHDRLQLVTAKDVVDDAVEIMAFRLRNAQVALELSDGLEKISLECQPTQIGQVLMNLIKNAVDSLATSTDSRRRLVRVSVADLGETVEFRVSDNGPGIAPAFRKRILEPYFTTKDRGKGTGLGLTLSRTIAERHGGKLSLDERDTSLTTFVLSLPRRASERRSA